MRQIAFFAPYYMNRPAHELVQSRIELRRILRELVEDSGATMLCEPTFKFQRLLGGWAYVRVQAEVWSPGNPLVSERHYYGALGSDVSAPV